MEIKELAEKSGVSKFRIYQIARRIGRIPTLSEIEKLKKKGRPQLEISEQEKLYYKFGKCVKFKDFEQFKKVCDEYGIETIADLVEKYKGE